MRSKQSLPLPLVTLFWFEFSSQFLCSSLNKKKTSEILKIYHYYSNTLSAYVFTIFNYKQFLNLKLWSVMVLLRIFSNSRAHCKVMNLACTVDSHSYM